MAQDDCVGGDVPEVLVGNVGGAWRIGTAVHRPVGPWTPAVHELLRFLAPRIDHVPRVLGFDDLGREVLTYLPGRVVNVETELLTSAQIESLVAWTRTFHDTVVDFSHPGPWRYAQPVNPTIIGHNDIGPYNACFDGDRLVGVFDWDMAGPSTAELELAFIAWSCVPLWRDIGTDPTAERLGLIASTYGHVSARDILSAVPVRIQRMLDWIPAAAAGGDPGLVNLMAQGEPDRSQQYLDQLRRRIPDIARQCN